MGSTPAHIIKADLDGTGELVDLTAAVSGFPFGFVDLRSGINAVTGRSDWTAPQPRPGSLSFTLDNSDGRFTPGVTSVYSVGLVNGVLVEWTCSTGDPATVIDEFARADGTLDGSSAADGTDSQVWDTLSVAGTSAWRIVSQRALPSTGAEDTFAVVDLGKTDATITATLAALHVTITSRRTGLVFRMSDHLNYWRFGPSPSSATWQLDEVVAGATVASTVYAVAPAASDVVSVTVNSDQLVVSLNGAVVLGPIKMTSNLAGTLTGFYGRRYSSGVTVQDDVSSWERISASVPDQRIRRYRAGTPELSFPRGVAGGSVVTVDCLDTLADLANRRMRQMVDEVAFAQQPVAYWPLADSGRGVEAQAQDISGNAEAPLVPFGTTELFSWQEGVGPSTDGRSALMLQPDATTGALNSVDLSPGLTLSRALGTSGVTHEWRTEIGRGVSYGENLGGWGFSLWFSVRDIYGATFAAADTAGPFTILARCGEVAILWRHADRRIALAGHNGSTVVTLTDLPALDVGAVHHVFIRRNLPVSGGEVMAAWVNGSPSAVSLNGGGAGVAVPPTVTLGALPGLVPAAPWGTGTTTLYTLSGTIACAAVYTNDAALAMDTGGDIPEFYPVGKTGPDETADLRFQRIGNYLRRSDVAFSPQGSPQTSLIGPQDTGRQSMLAAMCDALRLEEANLDTITVDGVDTVRAWLGTENRPTTAVITVDVDGDGDGVPQLSYDASGVAVQVEARGFSTAVTWLDTSAPERWRDTSASLSAATDNVADLRALAQFRALLGRAETLVPTKVKIDAVTSSADLTAALLTLRPMMRVALTGLPATVTGYSGVECILTGVVERHSLGRSSFELLLTPDLPYVEGVIEDAAFGEIPEPYTFLPVGTYGHPQDYAQGVGGYVGRQYPMIYSLTNVATTATLETYVEHPAGTGFADTEQSEWVFDNASLGVDPVYLMIDDEIVMITGCGAQSNTADTSSDGYMTYVTQQSLTIARAQLGTTAAAHAQSGGDLSPNPPSPIIHSFLGLDSCFTF